MGIQNSPNSYLKGIHQTLDGWRPNYDKDGWKITSKKGGTDNSKDLGQQHVLEMAVVGGWDNVWSSRTKRDTSPPTKVKAATRLKPDIKALMRLTSL